VAVVLSRFLPRDEEFFEKFNEAAATAAETSILLLQIVESEEERERKVRRLRDLEHQGDDITHRIYSSLNSTFVTPLDREDIQSLAANIDDVVDALEEVGRRLWLYRIGSATETARLLARIADEQCAIIAKAVPMLETVAKQATQMRTAVLEIHRLENEADDALTQALATLYDGITEVPQLITAIRWQELYQLLEESTDRCEHVANALEGILLKHA
jgi:predicted phosphate transport protein (TIGR00153 family)